jgi:iron(III) transport system ATP-binding protein
MQQSMLHSPIFSENRMDRQDIYLSTEAVSKRFEQFVALEKVSFTARRGEFLCILGPSGCGKTTLLRVLAGLEPQSEGKVCIEGRDVSNLPVSKRNIGIVFQSYALFPNLTARGNIAYGLKGRERNRGNRTRKVDELLDIVGLRGLGRHYPSQLSGGQQQRVALARALAVAPDLLLLDEPLSALDAKVRIMLRAEIRRLQQRLGVTTIMVTHDQEEALTMADRILVINKGRLVQQGTPHEIYDHPATPFVAAFIGAMNFIPDAVKMPDGMYGLGEHHLRVGDEIGTGNLPVGSHVTIGIRPEDIIVLLGDIGANTLHTRVAAMEYRGSLFRLNLRLNGMHQEPLHLEADVPAEKIRRLNIRTDMELPVELPLNRLRVYDAETLMGLHAC